MISNQLAIHTNINPIKPTAMHPIHILLVEDNEGDILLTTEALAEWSDVNKISIARDGKEAIDFMDLAAAGRSESLPSLILLDVNLPRRNGHEVLRYIKEKETIRHIPIIMLTTSCSREDIILGYQLQANCFISKPLEVNDFSKTITAIRQFWASTSALSA